MECVPFPLGSTWKTWIYVNEDTKSPAQKMKFSMKDFFSKCDQIRKILPIWSYLHKESLTENFIFCEVKS